MNLDLSDNRIAEVPAELTSLRFTSIGRLALAGNLLAVVPPQIGTIENLFYLDLSRNKLGGPMTTVISHPARLRGLDLSDNPFTPGPIPGWIRFLDSTYLNELKLRNTGRTGPLPAWLGARPHLNRLDLGGNPFTAGPIPDSFARLQALWELRLDRTHRMGPIPAWLGDFRLLEDLSLAGNPFDPGPIPPELRRQHSLLALLDLGDTHRTGPLPAWVADLSRLKSLRLERNHLEGGIPKEWGSLTGLELLSLRSNQLAGQVPAELTALAGLHDRGGLDLRWNALGQGDGAVVSFLNSKHAEGIDFRATQTVQPRAVTARAVGGELTISWSPVRYRTGSGGFLVERATSPGGPFTRYTRTFSKDQTSVVLDGYGRLEPGRTYYFRVRTMTAAHADNANRVVSLSSPTASVTIPVQPAGS